MRIRNDWAYNTAMPVNAPRGPKAQQAVQREERRMKVAGLLTEGYSPAHIARELRLTRSVVDDDIEAIRIAWRESTMASATDAFLIDIERLDRATIEVFGAMNGRNKAVKLQAVDRLVRILTRRAAMYGYDKQQIVPAVSLNASLDLVEDDLNESAGKLSRLLSAFEEHNRSGTRRENGEGGGGEV